MLRFVCPLIAVGLLAGPVLAADPVVDRSVVEGLVITGVPSAWPGLTVDAAPIPEPTSLALYAAGTVGLLLRRTRRGAAA